MAEHRARLRPRRRLLRAAVGLVVLVLLVTGGNATSAYWTGAATVRPPALSSSTFDIVLNGNTSDDVTLSGLAVSDLLPGDSRAAALAVANASQAAPARFSIAGRGTGDLLPALQVQLFDGAPTNTGSTTTGYTGVCSGTSIAGPVTLTTSDTTLLTVAASNARAVLAPGATQNLCVRVTVLAAAPQSTQGTSGTVTLVVTGRSVVR